MSTFSRTLHCDGCTDRLTYQRNIALLAVGKAAVDLIAMSLVPGLDPTTIAMAWLNPFVLVKPWLDGAMPFVICLGTLAFFSALVWNSVHRCRHAGFNHWLGLFAAVPFLGLPVAVVLALLPGRRHTVWDIAG